jgi:hypothetical protein
VCLEDEDDGKREGPGLTARSLRSPTTKVTNGGTEYMARQQPLTRNDVDEIIASLTRMINDLDVTGFFPDPSERSRQEGLYRDTIALVEKSAAVLGLGPMPSRVM